MLFATVEPVRQLVRKLPISYQKGQLVQFECIFKFSIRQLFELTKQA
jgi:hypothetical protein